MSSYLDDDQYITVVDGAASPTTASSLQYAIRPPMKAHQLSFQGEQQPSKKMKVGGGSGSGGGLIARFFGTATVGGGGRPVVV
jgi:hypothetical protein